MAKQAAKGRSLVDAGAAAKNLRAKYGFSSVAGVSPPATLAAVADDLPEPDKWSENASQAVQEIVREMATTNPARAREWEAVFRARLEEMRADRDRRESPGHP